MTVHSSAQPIPFTIQLLPAEGKIVLSGDLDGSTQVAMDCGKVAREAALQSPHWTIDARQARLPTGGVEVWIAVVRDYMIRCQLDYVPSQLAQNIMYDDQYTHPRTKYLEETGMVV